MSQSGTIVRRSANTFIPDAYLELVTAANPNGYSAAFVEDGNVKFVKDTAGATVDDIKETMQAYPDKDITFYFCQSDAALNQDDLPPYVLLQENKNTPLILGFIDGNFPNFAKSESSHPPEFFFAHEYLVPKFEGMAEMSEDLNKVTAAMQKPYFKKELLLNCVSRGYVTLVCANGTDLTFAQGDTSAEYKWGWVSNNHGYALAPPEEKKVEKKKGGIFGRSTVREPANVPPKEEIAEAVKVNVTAVSIIKNFKGWTVKDWAPKPSDSRSNKKDGYKTRIGYLPPGWEQCPTVRAYYDPGGKLSTFAQMNKALGLEAAGLQKLAANPPRMQGKDTEPDKVEHDQTLPAESKAVTTEILPIMSPPGREYIEKLRGTEQYKKMIAENAAVINDPKKFEGYEAKFVDFAKQMGAKSMDEFAMWDDTMLFNLANDRPQEMMVMARAFINIYNRNRAKGAIEEAPINTEVVNDPPKKKGGIFGRAAA